MISSRPRSWLAKAALLLATLPLPAAAQAPTPALPPVLQAALGAPAARPSAVVRTEQVRAELLVHAPEGWAAGRPMWLGLQFTHAPGWHTYWKNPGDSGLPTELSWQLPAGVQAGAIGWPTPAKFPLGNLANYGYEGTVLLPVPLQWAPGFAADRLDVRLKASWLVCRRECIPQEGEFTLDVPTRGVVAAHAAAFDAALAAQPRALEAGGSRIAVEGQTLKVRLENLPAAARGQELAFFPEASGIIEPAGAWTQGWQGGQWSATLPLSPLRGESPGRMAVVVAASGGAAWRVDLPVAGTWPAVAPLPGVSPALEAALRANASSADAAPAAPVAASALGLAAALLGALVGGLLLNLMPCVFPVLAIKMLGFVQTDTRARRLASGAAYTAGVLLSFLALGAALLALRAAGEQLGWGFQLQSPGVVAALAALFTLIGLNLMGVFEVGNLLPARLAGLQARHPAADAFLSGVLAVAVASPCTAPFMGASLGLALGLPAWQALAVFGALGLGMALPYLAASLLPGLARRMPRPGAWMLRLKQLLAFPMFATVVWLVWVLGQQTGLDGAVALLVLLLLLALGAWSLGLAGGGRWLALGLSGMAAAAGLSWAWPQWQASGSASLAQVPAGSTPFQSELQAEPPAGWQPWSAGRVEALMAQGRPVLVDFTAAWCVTCQYNKKTALEDADVLADARARGLVLLRADWTRRDPAVTEALRGLGRSGVPVYAVYAPGRPPELLSEILSVRELRDAIARVPATAAATPAATPAQAAADLRAAPALNARPSP